MPCTRLQFMLFQDKVGSYNQECVIDNGKYMKPTEENEIDR